MSKLTRFVTCVFAAGSVMIAPLALAAPASAATSTTVAFVDETNLSVPFGSDWSFAVEATGLTYIGYESEEVQPVALEPTAGTLSVTVSGFGGTFSSGIPIQADGHAYVTQPAAQPLLPAGDYQVTAIFVPAGGTDYASSQTATPATLTIVPIGLAASAMLVSDPSVSDDPFIEASLSGDYLAALGGSPPGTWSFTIKDGSSQVFAVDVPQKQGAEGPLRVAVPTDLRAGRNFTLTSVFTPVSEVAGGIVLTAPKDATLTTPGTGILDAVTTRVPFPIWLIFAIGGAILILVIVVVVLGARLSRRNSPDTVSDTRVTDSLQENDATAAEAWSLSQFDSLEVEPSDDSRSFSERSDGHPREQS